MRRYRDFPIVCGLHSVRFVAVGIGWVMGRPVAVVVRV